MQIYFIRHGQTDWNAEKRLQGQLDVPINAIGEQQATRNGQKLKTLISNPDKWNFIASPLIRTRKTMELIRESMNLPPLDYQTDDRLKEVHFGDWQNRTWKEIEAASPEVISKREADKWNTIAPGANGESYAMLFKRVIAWLNSLEKNTVCVSHGGVNRCLQKHFLNLNNHQTEKIQVPQDRIMRIHNSEIEWI